VLSIYLSPPGAQLIALASSRVRVVELVLDLAATISHSISKTSRCTSNLPSIPNVWVITHCMSAEFASLTSILICFPNGLGFYTVEILEQGFEYSDSKVAGTGFGALVMISFSSVVCAIMGVKESE